MNLSKIVRCFVLFTACALGTSTCLIGGENETSNLLPINKPVKDPNRPNITVPEDAIQATVGDFVIVAAISDAKSIVWVVPDFNVLSRLPADELANKNKLIVGCKRSGIHSVYAVAVDDQGRISDQKSVKIHVKGGEPGPEPGPGPEPAPVLPDGKYKLAAFAYNAAKSYVKNDNDRVKGAAALIKSLNGVVSRIAAGTIKDPETALAELEAANASSLRDAGVARATWDAWGSALQKEWYPLYKNGQMKSLDDFVVAFKEIVTGLSAIK